MTAQLVYAASRAPVLMYDERFLAWSCDGDIHYLTGPGQLWERLAEVTE